MADIKAYIFSNSISQRELSQKLGYTEAYISKVLNGKLPINDKFLAVFKAAYPDFDDNQRSIHNEARIVDPQWMEVIYLPITAQAGYLDSLEQDERLELNLETMLIPTEHEKGNYVIFEVSGHSMNDGTSRSIQEGDKLLCKELQRDHWRNKLHYNQYLFVLAGRDGIVCKQITAHDVSTGTVTCHSWNELYRDYTVQLDDIYKMFYVKKIVDRRILF